MSPTRTAVLLSFASVICASLLSQELTLVESIDRHLVRQNPSELAIAVEVGPNCQIGSDMLTDTVVNVLRRGALKKREPSRVSNDYFALRVAVSCGTTFLVEVDFTDRLPPASPGGPPGVAIRYLPSYNLHGLQRSPQQTLAAAKRSVEAAVNDYLRANFTTR
jgi:hypothetical protein